MTSIRPSMSSITPSDAGSHRSLPPSLLSHNQVAQHKTVYCLCAISYIIIYMKNFRNSDWLKAVRFIPNSAILCYHSGNFCYHILARKSLHGRTKCGSQDSANSGNISLKFAPYFFKIISKNKE